MAILLLNLHIFFQWCYMYISLLGAPMSLSIRIRFMQYIVKKNCIHQIHIYGTIIAPRRQPFFRSYFTQRFGSQCDSVWWNTENCTHEFQTSLVPISQHMTLVLLAKTIKMMQKIFFSWKSKNFIEFQKINKIEKKTKLKVLFSLFFKILQFLPDKSTIIFNSSKHTLMQFIRIFFQNSMIWLQFLRAHIKFNHKTVHSIHLYYSLFSLEQSLILTYVLFYCQIHMTLEEVRSMSKFEQFLINVF